MNFGAILLLAATFVRPLERVGSMDPIRAQSVYEARAVQLVYETVLGVDYAARPYRLIPAACELPVVSADRLTYTFRLRSLELSAQDVVRSLERLRITRDSPNAWMLRSVRSIEALDAQTVCVKLSTPCHFFPWLMAMSPAAIQREDGSGTGPFRLAAWRKNHEMVFTRRKPTGEKQFDTVRYLVVDDASTQWLMFLKGELDFLGEVSRDTWEAAVDKQGRLDPALTAKGIRLMCAPTMEVMYVGMNMRDPVVGTNRKLRQALNAAFDYPAWERFNLGRTMPCASPVPPSVAGHLDTPFAYAFNLAKARQLLAEAGYPQGVDPATGRRLVLRLAVGRASTETRESGELMASFYERLGIKLELEYFTWDAFLTAVGEGRVQLYRLAWIGDYPDAENFLQLFHSRNVSPGPNHSHYVNPAFDEAYDHAMAAATEAERLAYWQTCQEILREDCPWIFVSFSQSGALVRRRVGNFIPGDFQYGREAEFTVVTETDEKGGAQ